MRRSHGSSRECNRRLDHDHDVDDRARSVDHRARGDHDPGRRRNQLAMKRRVELGLVVLAALITVAAYVLVSMGNDASVPANIGPFFAAVLVVFIGAHIATRRLAPNADSLLLPLAVLLNGLGYVFIVRVANDVRGAKDLPGLQANWTLLGVAGVRRDPVRAAPRASARSLSLHLHGDRRRSVVVAVDARPRSHR